MQKLWKTHRGGASRQGARSPQERLPTQYLTPLATANIVTDIYDSFEILTNYCFMYCFLMILIVLYFFTFLPLHVLNGELLGLSCGQNHLFITLQKYKKISRKPNAFPIIFKKKPCHIVSCPRRDRKSAASPCPSCDSTVIK